MADAYAEFVFDVDVEFAAEADADVGVDWLNGYRSDEAGDCGYGHADEPNAFEDINISPNFFVSF